MIARGKWKLPTPVKQSKDVKPCKEDQYRNPATGRCVKIKHAKPVKPVKPHKGVKLVIKPQNNTISGMAIAIFTNKNVTFTGIRDKNLEVVIEANGGKVFSTVSKKVNLLIAKDINANSVSIIKAKQLNIEIIQYDKLMNL
jgi:NAD-dependent DNA ligase